MNDELKKWKEDVNDNRVDPMIFDQIDTLDKKQRHRKYGFRALMSMMTAVALFVGAVNLSPAFYAFAQEGFLRDIADVVKISRDATENAIKKEQFQVLDKEFNGVKLEYLIIEGRRITLVYAGDANVSVYADDTFISMSQPQELNKGLMFTFSSGFENLENGSEIIVKVDGKELRVAVDLSKKIETRVIEVNKEFAINDASNFKVTKIEMGQFVMDVYIEYPLNFHVANHELFVRNNQGASITQHMSMTQVGIVENDPLIYTIGVGTQTISKDATLTLGNLSWNDDASVNGTLNIVTGEVANLNPALKFVEFRDAGASSNESSDTLAIFSYRTDIRRMVSNPLMFDNMTVQSWSFRETTDGLTYYEITVPNNAVNNIATFRNNWGLHQSNYQYEVVID